MTVRVGIGLFTGQVPPGSARTFTQEYREVLELVRLAETSGFDSAWVSEHHGASDGYLPSPLAMLAAFAAATERIELGTGIVLTPLHDPLRLAEDAATVDQLSGGRLVLGLGLGWREEEFRMFGTTVSDRVPRTEEAIEVLRRAFTGRRFSFSGRAFSYDRVRVGPPPARAGGPPIYLGGAAERALRRIGRIADGFVADAPVDEARRQVAVVDDAARSVGRDPSALGLVILRNAFVSRDGDAWAAVRDGVAHQLGTYDAWDAGADTPARDELSPPEPDDAALRATTAAGDPEAVTRELRELVAPFRDRADVTVVVRLHYPGMDLPTAAGAVELFASEVAPALREA